jgi:hypothetical protein
MRLQFLWSENSGAFSPGCSSDIVKVDGVSPLACLLMDDGGQELLGTISWLKEGVKRIGLVKDSTVGLADWSRDAWGAELTKDQVKIYSLYDESYFELISLFSFEAAMLAWINFIEMGPMVGGGEVEV